MAGSQPEVCAVPSFSDPILVARVEAIRQLAGGISDRVAVVDREFNIVYANSSAWTNREPGDADAHQAKCYQAFAQRTDPCGACPATKVFETPDVQSISCGTEGDGTACGMRQAFPLAAGDGQVTSMLVLFNPLSQTTLRTALPVSNDLPALTVREHLGDLIGRSAAMQQLFDMIVLVAESQATVLIQGESGTGKELVAKTIHRLSDRRDKPFVVVDCGSLP